MERLLQRLVAETKARQPVLVVAPELAGLETLLRSLLSGHLVPAQQPQPGSFRRDWNAVVCFSCGKGATVRFVSFYAVPARVSVVLVEETEVWCSMRLASVPVDVDEQMFVGVACPADVAESPSDVAKQVADDTASMADAGILFPADSAGTLSPPDPAGILFPAVPAEILFLAGPVGPVGTLSPSNSAGILFPAVPAGILFPVGPDQDGTLSPTDPTSAFPTFPADSAGMLFPAAPTGIPFAVDPDFDGTLSPTDPAGVLFPAVLTEFPVLMDPVVALSPPDPTVFDNGSVVDMAVTEEVRLAIPDVFGSRVVVAMVGVDAAQTGEAIPM